MTQEHSVCRTGTGTRGPAPSTGRQAHTHNRAGKPDPDAFVFCDYLYKGGHIKIQKYIKHRTPSSRLKEKGFVKELK